MFRPLPQLCVALLTAAGAAGGADGGVAEPELVSLTPGAQRVLSFPGGAQLSVDRAGVVEHRELSNGMVLIIALGEGETTGTVAVADGSTRRLKFVVRPFDAQAYKEELEKIFGEVDGLHVVALDGGDPCIFTTSQRPEAQEVVDTFRSLYPRRGCHPITPGGCRDRCRELEEQLRRPDGGTGQHR